MCGDWGFGAAGVQWWGWLIIIIYLGLAIITYGVSYRGVAVRLGLPCWEGRCRTSGCLRGG